MAFAHRNMNRGRFLRLLGAATAGAAALAWTPPAIHAIQGTGGRKRNVLFISIDDLNDWIGCLGGHPDTRTPNLDRLAARGTLFTNAHCPAPLCNPSRAALMTGIRPSTSGVYLNSQPMRESKALADAVTLPMYFRAAGYETFGAGKIYHGSFPDPRSWDRYWLSQETNKPPDPAPPRRPFQGIGGNFDWGPLDVADEEMGDARVARWAQDELSRKHDRPFFMGVGIFRPHLEWYVPRKYFDMFPPEKVTLPDVKADDLDDVPGRGRRMAKPDGDHKQIIDSGKWRQAVSAYLACIAFADAMVGRVIDAFDQSPDRDNTVIILWSDHGWHLGEKLHWRKFSLWEEATHNVLMVVSPGLTQPAQRCNRPVNLLDIYPTLVEVCGLPAADGLEGTSLMPLLKNPDIAWNRPAVTTYMRGNHSVRSEEWRYIRYADGTEELYDRRKDEMEWVNLAGASKYDRIKKDLARHLPAVNAEESPIRKTGSEVE